MTLADVYDYGTTDVPNFFRRSMVISDESETRFRLGLYLPADIDLPTSLKTRSANMLYNTVCSLYMDQIKPFLGDISHRLTELFPESCLPSNESVLSAVNADSRLLVHVPQDMSICILLRDVPPGFSGWIDPTDPSIVYPETIHEALNAFLYCSYSRSGTDHSHIPIESGRYGLARVLSRLFLEGRSCVHCNPLTEKIGTFTLGRLCHLVQSHIQRGYLCYEQNQLKPSFCCNQIAEVFLSKLPISHGTDGATREIESIEQLHRILATIIAPATNTVELSQIKKILLAQYQILLNPRKLGFLKVSEIFSKSPLMTTNYSLIKRQNTVFVKAVKSAR